MELGLKNLETSSKVSKQNYQVWRDTCFSKYLFTLCFFAASMLISKRFLLAQIKQVFFLTALKNQNCFYCVAKVWAPVLAETNNIFKLFPQPEVQLWPGADNFPDFNFKSWWKMFSTKCKKFNHWNVFCIIFQFYQIPNCLNDITKDRSDGQ